MSIPAKLQVLTERWATASPAERANAQLYLIELCRALSAMVAVGEASFSLSGLKGPGGTDLPPVTGLCLGVHQQQGGLWFAAAVQCMVPPPTAQPG